MCLLKLNLVPPYRKLKSPNKSLPHINSGVKDLYFDIRGNLKPYERITMDLNTFKFFFVDSFENSELRGKIFDEYQRYLIAFSREITSNFIQWIDGSFVTNRIAPNDLDFVTLIDHEVFEAKEGLIESKFRLAGAKIYFDGLDAYTVKVYPENHSKRNITEFDLVYWDNWFSQTKKNRRKLK